MFKFKHILNMFKYFKYFEMCEILGPLLWSPRMLLGTV